MLIKGTKTDDIISVNNKAEFKIDESNTKVVKLMADTLYKDKVSSVFREILSNSIDAQLLTKSKNPLEVTFRFYKDDIYIDFRDYGPGIDPDKIVEIYCTFFNSSKSDTNKQIGGYGLGCKSPISLTSSYDVFNYYNGKRYHYNIHLNDKHEMLIEKKDVTDTNEDNGIKVSIKFFNRKEVNDKNIDTYKYFKNYFKELICCSPIPIKVKFISNDKEEKSVEGIISNNKVRITNRLIFVDYRPYYELFSNYHVANFYNNEYTLEGIGKFSIREKGYITIADSVYAIRILNGFIPYEVTHLIEESEIKEKYTYTSSNILSPNLGKSKNTFKTVAYGLIPGNSSSINPISSFGSLYIMSNIGDLSLTTSREDIIDNDENRKHLNKLVKEIETLNVEVPEDNTNTFKRINKDEIKEDYKPLFMNKNDEGEPIYNIFLTPEKEFVYYLNNKRLDNEMTNVFADGQSGWETKVLVNKNNKSDIKEVLALNEISIFLKDIIHKNLRIGFNDIDISLLDDASYKKVYTLKYEDFKRIIDISKTDYKLFKIAYDRFDKNFISNISALNNLYSYLLSDNNISLTLESIAMTEEKIVSNHVKVNDKSSSDLLKFMFG